MDPKSPPPPPVCVSVLMSVLDPDPGYLRAALESVLRQTLADFEVVLLEDPGAAPEDATAALVADLADPRIRHVRNPERMPLAESRARAVELARGGVVAILDADDICHPERLERQLRFLREHPGIDVVGTQIEVISAQNEPIGYRRYPLDHDRIVTAMRRYNPLAHPTVAMRRDALLRAGNYRPWGGGTTDDYELWSRMAGRGHRFANLPEPLLRYRLHGGSMKSRLVRQTLADTLGVKRTYWRGRLGWRDRLRMAGERVLTWLPTAVVGAMFRRLTIRRGLKTVAPGMDWPHGGAGGRHPTGRGLSVGGGRPGG